jgi:hypothetical protein
MKRTTLILEESCLEGIRNLARREGKTLSKAATELFAEGLRRRKADIDCDSDADSDLLNNFPDLSNALDIP